VNITRSGKTLLTSGSGGRSSRTGYTATVFGGPGLLGTHLVSKLARHGTITIVPFREEMKKRHLKVTGDLGVVNFMEWDLRNIKSIEDSVKHSDIVYNLVGRDYETKNFSYHDVHVEGARRIAEAVAKHNVARFIHVSSHSADVNSSSQFYQTKAEGEQVVRGIIPDATIVRPGPLYGNGLNFLTNIASSDYILTANHGKEKLRPTYISDVASALETIGFDDSTAGKTYELFGPNEYTYKEILDKVQSSTFLELPHVNLPKSVYTLLSRLTQFIYWRTTSPDEVERMYIDQFVDENALTFSDLGITPQKLDDHIVRLLRHFRSSVHLHETVEESEKRQRENAKYTNIY
jgi:NADH dehydrogenase (ubiquinone) 1 alpha subcomplex subunit 9